MAFIVSSSTVFNASARTAICQLQSAVVAPEQPSFSWGRSAGWANLRERILARQPFIYAFGGGSDKYGLWN